MQNYASAPPGWRIYINYLLFVLQMEVLSLIPIYYVIYLRPYWPIDIYFILWFIFLSMLFIMLFKLFQPWWLETLHYLLCLFDKPHLCVYYFLVLLWSSNFIPYISCPIYLRSPGFFSWRKLETNMCALVWPLLLRPLPLVLSANKVRYTHLCIDIYL